MRSTEQVEHASPVVGSKLEASRSVSPVPSLTEGSTAQSTVSDNFVEAIANVILREPRLELSFNALGTSDLINSPKFKAIFQPAFLSLAKRLEVEAKDPVQKDVSRRMQRFAPMIVSRTASSIFPGRSNLDFQRTGPQLTGKDRIEAWLTQRYANLEDPLSPSDGKALDEEGYDDDGDDGELPELPGYTDRMIGFITSSTAFEELSILLSSLLPPTTNGLNDPAVLGKSPSIWKELSLKWNRTLNVNPPALLKKLSGLVHNTQMPLQHVRFLMSDPLHLSDHFKNLLETYSGEQWVWEPFGPPRKPLAQGLIRVLFKGQYNGRNWVDIPSELAMDCKDFLALVSPDASGSGGNGASGNISGSLVGTSPTLCSFCSRQSALPSGPQIVPSSTAAGLPGSQIHYPHHSPTLYILFCALRGSVLRHSQIEVKPPMDDNTFMEAVRRLHYQMVGVWRFHLGLRVFEYCSFAKYTRKARNRLAKYYEPELPLGSEYVYEPRPQASEKLHIPPIDKYEWYDFLHNNSYYHPCCACVLHRIPKRKQRFIFDPHRGREDMYGLQAELSIAAIRVLFWSFLVLIPGSIFFIWWIATRPNDWQTASVIFTSTTGLLTYIWLPLNKHFKQKF